MMDERSEKLKSIILQQYPSVRMFAQEKRILAYYNLLNDNGRRKVEDYLKDMGQIPAYGRPVGDR